MRLSRRLEREVQGVIARPGPARIPLHVPRSEVQRQLAEIERRGGSVGVRPAKTWRWGKKFQSYEHAEPWEVIAKLGTLDVAHVLIQNDPVGYARWRADGWRREDLDTASAYDRLSELAASGLLSLGILTE